MTFGVHAFNAFANIKHKYRYPCFDKMENHTKKKKKMFLLLLFLMLLVYVHAHNNITTVAELFMVSPVIKRWGKFSVITRDDPMLNR